MSWPAWSAAAGAPAPPATSAAAAAAAAFSGYTPEQWAAAQTHNWQQWAQWQEQYRQWQLQYGDKYTEQMMNFQQVTAQPPLPPTTPAENRPPPPPPPDGPPPQTLKGSDDKSNASGTKSQANPNHNFYASMMNAQYYYPLMAAAAAKAEADKKDKKENTLEDYYSTWYSQMASLNSYTAQAQAAAVVQNSYVSEEEKQFDVQFKKWEEEFEAWKQQNLNHPDKAAYQEYEKKFQACRAQLMERKEQMRAKRMTAMMSQKPPATHADVKSNNGQKSYAGGSSYFTDDYYRKMASEDKSYESVDVSAKNGDSNAFLSDGSNFLKSVDSKGIPGLDLIDERARTVDVLDIEDGGHVRNQPDLKAISKGINSILGDQKLLNMLSMVTKDSSKNVYANPKNGTSKWNDETNSSDVSGQSYSNSMNQLYKLPYQNYGNDAAAGQNYSQTYGAGQSGSASLIVGSSQMYPARDALADKSSALTMNNTEYYQQSMYQMAHQGYDRDGHQRDYYSQSDRTGSYGAGGDYDSAAASAKHQYMDYPILEPHTIVDYQHKSIRPIIEFLEPVQTFDYGHMSSNSANLKESTKDNWTDYDSYRSKSKTTEFPRTAYTDDKSNDSSYRNKGADYSAMRYDDRHKERVDRTRMYDRNFGRERDLEKRDERSRGRFEDRSRFQDRNREMRDKYERSSSLEEHCELLPKSDSREQSPEDWNDDMEVPPEEEETTDIIKNVVMIDDILELPGRDVRPEKVVIILRGLPGSGKSYLAKLIKDKEVENGGSARILSMDDYFMFENEISVEDPETGRKINKREMKYEYDPTMEHVYITSLAKSFRRTVTDGYFPFIIVDNVNDQLQHFSEIENIGKQHNFKVYICEMDVDVNTCHKRNIHERKIDDIENINENWSATPSRFTMLDATTLLQNAAIDHVQMEDVSDGDMEEPQKETSQNEEEEVLAPFSSKWDNMDETDKLARLDGTSKPLRHNISTMEDFLQLDEWEAEKPSQPGKKSVRWADIEERRKQEKMRAIGFVVGQTDWDRMNDPTQGSSALTQTKYIERI